MNWKYGVVFPVLFLALSGVAARAQTDVSASVYGTITNTTSGNGTIQSVSDSGGGMIGLRHIVNPLVGFEANFGINGANQNLSTQASSCGLRCNNPPVPVAAKGYEFTVNYVVSGKFGNLRPFAEAGLGFVYTNPTASVIGLNALSRPAWVGGGGADWYLAPRMGIRAQYRVKFYKAPDVYFGYSPTGEYVHAQEPMIGVFFRF